MRRSSLTPHELRKLLDYNPKMGHFTWRVTRGPYAQPGAIAGTLTKDGYRQICIDQICYRSARLAVLWMTGRWPETIVDHKNMIRDDDRWINLREATHSQNHGNSRGQKQRKLLFKGVTLTDDGTYQAQIRINYQMIYLGRFNTPEAAHAAYTAAASKYFGKFARV